MMLRVNQQKIQKNLKRRRFAWGASLFTTAIGFLLLHTTAQAITPKTKDAWNLKGSCNYRWNTVWEDPLFSIWRHQDTQEFAIDLFDAQNMLPLEYRDFQCAYFQLHRDRFVIVLSRYLQNNYVGVILEKDEKSGTWDRTEIHCEMVPKTVAPNRPQGNFFSPSSESVFPCGG